MTRLPLFSGVSVPQGLQARIPFDLQRLKAQLSEYEYLQYIQYLLGLMENYTGTIINMIFPINIESLTVNSLGTEIIITFNNNMNSPAGYHADFSSLVDSLSNTFYEAYNLSEKVFSLKLLNSVNYQESITLSYNGANIKDVDNTLLEPFSNLTVSNQISAPNDYQHWAGLPNTPVLTTLFPYQAVFNSMSAGAEYRQGLIASTQKIVKNSTKIFAGGNTTNTKIYLMPIDGSNWGSANPFSFYEYAAGDIVVEESNCNIYATNQYNTVNFVKTRIK